MTKKELSQHLATEISYAQSDKVDLTVDDWLEKIEKLLTNRYNEIIHDILETILQERDKSDEIDKNGYDHSYAIVKGFLK